MNCPKYKYRYIKKTFSEILCILRTNKPEHETTRTRSLHSKYIALLLVVVGTLFNLTLTVKSIRTEMCNFSTLCVFHNLDRLAVDTTCQRLTHTNTLFVPHAAGLDLLIPAADMASHKTCMFPYSPEVRNTASALRLYRSTTDTSIYTGKHKHFILTCPARVPVLFWIYHPAPSNPY